MTTNIVWITGATSGSGEALSRSCPWPDTVIISVSRREHPDHETGLFDLTDMESWNRVGEHLTERLATFRGERAVFIHNALYYWGGRAFMGEGDPANHRDEMIANVVSPLALGDMFIRAAQPAVDAGVDVGLVQISSASARIAYPGLAI
jgi:NADP-dependent 3-hydroxy acid dehydrogenase YdfG